MVFCRGFFGEKKEYVKQVLVVGFFVQEGPPGFVDKILIFRNLGMRFRVEFESGIGREYLFENKIGLLMGKLVGKVDRFGQRDIDMCVCGKQVVEKFRIVLEECFFDVLCSCV